MRRRTFMQIGLGSVGLGSFVAAPVWAAFAKQLAKQVENKNLDAAVKVLADATTSGQVEAASLCVRQGDQQFAKSFGAAKTPDAMFLLASISKPMAMAALMTLYDQGKFRLEDPVRKFIPEFTGDGREQITILHLLTHTCGLPDQLPENGQLRKSHAPLSKFIAGAIRTPLLFAPGEKYKYSSMGILLGCEIAQRITGENFLPFMDKALFRPLGMQHSALGMGNFKLEDMMQCQVKNAAPESGSGDAAAKAWDWNSPYWRKLGVPWGGVHTTAPDVVRFFTSFLHPDGAALKPETARLMIRNHNPSGFTPRGLGFAMGTKAASPGCSEQTFSHGGSTGTFAWADPATDTVFAVLTTLPGGAAKVHPRKVASDLIASGK